MQPDILKDQRLKRPGRFASCQPGGFGNCGRNAISSCTHEGKVEGIAGRIPFNGIMERVAVPEALRLKPP